MVCRFLSCIRVAGAAALMGKYPGGFGNMMVKAAKGKDVLAGQFWGVRTFVVSFLEVVSF